MRRRSWDVFLLGVLLALSSCRQHEAPAPVVVARVGDNVLTLEEARSHIDTLRGLAAAQLRDYVNWWVDTELLYQEAKRRGIDGSDQFRRQLDDVRKQLANESLLDQEVYGDSAGIDDQTMRAYHSQHNSEFPVRENMVKLNVLVMNDREKASEFVAAVSRGASWPAAVRNILRDSLTAPAVLSSVDGKYFTERTIFPPELWKVAGSLAINDLSFPVKTQAGYFVLQPLERLRAGDAAGFEVARDEVRQRMMMEKRHRRYADFIGTLRSRTSVEVVLPQMRTSDSLAVHE